MFPKSTKRPLLSNRSRAFSYRQYRLGPDGGRAQGRPLRSQVRGSRLDEVGLVDYPVRCCSYQICVLRTPTRPRLIAHRPRRQNMGLFECLTTYSLSCYYIVRNKRGSVEPAGDPVGIVRVGDYLLAGSLWQLLQYSGVVEGKSCWHSWGMGKP